MEFFTISYKYFFRFQSNEVTGLRFNNIINPPL